MSPLQGAPIQGAERGRGIPAGVCGLCPGVGGAAIVFRNERLGELRDGRLPAKNVVWVG